MKILLSYGHDHTELVRKIKKDLEDLGYTVWMDEVGICAGDDWRQKIDGAIRESELVLAFVSEYSMRQKGVCRDELKIAYTYGCRIRLVLLDIGAKALIPNFLLNTQYLDLSELAGASSENLLKLYPLALSKLVELIKNDDHMQHKGIVSQLALRLHPNRAMSFGFIHDRAKFSEREWLDEYIRSWTSGESRLSAIIGFPGSGKSCYCANAFYNPDKICSIIFCKQFKGKNSVAKVLKNIAYQLSVALPAYAKRLAWILDNGDIDLEEAGDLELFDALISEPLCLEIDGGHLPIVIVIDGIDELSENGCNKLADLLAETADNLPSFVHFILTTRNNPAVTRVLAGRKCVELLPKDRKTALDVYNYLENALKDHLPSDSADVTLRSLTEMCNGSFLYASLIVEAVISGAISIADTDQYPEKIFDFYYRWMKALIPDEDEFAQKYADAFSILVAAGVPVSEHILMYALGWNQADKIKFIRVFRSFIIDRKALDGESIMELFHSSFANWLSDKSGAAGGYFADLERGLQLYSNSLFRAYYEKELKNSEATELIRVLLCAKKHERLLTIAQDKVFLNELVAYAERCQVDADTYQVAANIIESIKGLSEIDGQNTYADELVGAKIPYLEAIGEFAYGNLKRSAMILSPAMDRILQSCSRDEYIEALYVLGTALDWLGDRKGSVEQFTQLLEVAECENNNKYVARALCGLIWNDHFNDSEKGEMWIKKLSVLDNLDEHEKLTVDLIMARFLLTKGNLHESMKLYEKILNATDRVLWGYDRESVRNQMLMLEAIVAYYDNEMYENAIRTGEQIYKCIGGRGNLPECYCASWLAFSYLRSGLTEKGLRYLKLAEQLNCKSKRAIRSGWMDMHLMSLRTYFELESGNYTEAYKRYCTIEKMAQECDDAWVEGDACYSLFKLHFLFGVEMPEKDMNIYDKKLQDIAQKSRLPHLIFKSELVGMLRRRLEAKPDILTQLIECNLASVDVFSELCLCEEVAKRASMAQVAERIKKAVTERLEKIESDNPDIPFRDRNTIKSVLKRLNI